jgi:signal peptidase
MALLKRITSDRGNGAFRQSIELLNAGQAYRARWILSQALASNGKEDAAAWALLAFLAQDRTEAIRCLEQVTRLRPDNFWAREQLRDLRNRRPEHWQGPAISIPPFHPPLPDDEAAMGESSNARDRLPVGGRSLKKGTYKLGVIPDPQRVWPHGLKFRSLAVSSIDEIERPMSSRGLARAFRGVLDSLMMMAIFAAVVLLLAPRILGANLLVVLSQSMEPNIPMGSIVVSQPVAAADEIEVGDAITFQALGPNGEPALITHRVVEVLGDGIEIRLRTQGDAVEDPDMSLVSASNLVGRVWFNLPLVGYLIAFIRTPVGYLTIVGLPAALLILSEWVEILRSIREEKRSRVVRVPLAAAGSMD